MGNDGDDEDEDEDDEDKGEEDCIKQSLLPLLLLRPSSSPLWKALREQMVGSQDAPQSE